MKTNGPKEKKKKNAKKMKSANERRTSLFKSFLQD